MSKPDVTVLNRVGEALANFERDPAPARKLLKELLADDRESFREVALRSLRPLPDGPGRSFLVELLAEAGMLPACDPALFSLEEEIAVARTLAASDDSLDLKLARRLSGGAAPMSTDAALRTLTVLSAVGAGGRVLPLLIRLLRHPDPHLRSKAALLIGRPDMAPRTTEHLQGEPDPRVLANAVEALWGADTAAARTSLLEAAESPHPRVLGNALLGLFQIGETSAIRRIPKLAAHPDPRFRATAAWVMERAAHPRFLPVLAGMIRETDPRVRSRVFRALASLNRATARLAAAVPLRVHILSASSTASGLRTLEAAIATGDAGESGVLPTGLVVSEDALAVEDFTAHRELSPGPMALGLFLPRGDAGDRILSSLSALKRELDRWSPVRYEPGGSMSAILPVFAFLGAVSGPRHALLYADELGDEPAEAWADVIEQARGCSTAIHCVSGPGAAFPHGRLLAEQTAGTCFTTRSTEELGAACEKVFLSLLHPYRITYPAREEKVFEIKLEAYSTDSRGSDVFQVESS